MTLTVDHLREILAGLHMRISAMPDQGSILFCSETALAIDLTDGDANKAAIVPLHLAHVYSDADRQRPRGVIAPGLDRAYSDGAGRRFMLFALGTAKRIALEKLNAAIAALPMIECTPELEVQS